MATPDPCSLLWGNMKKQCEDAAGNPAGSVVSSLIPSVHGDFRTLMLRVAEVGVGLGLVLIAGHALLSQTLGSSKMGRTVKKVVK